jgi:hypothetical protein
MMTKTVVLDAETVAGNPWLTKFCDSNNNIQVPITIKDSADGIAFYISQLAYLEQKVYAVPYATITYLEDVPLNSDVTENMDEWAYRSYDGVTLAKFIGANAEDLPRVQMSADISRVPLAYGGIECHYSLDELRKSAAMNMPIDSMQAELAHRGAEEQIQRTAYYGDLARKMNGFLNNPNVTKTNAPVDITTATGQELFDLVNDAIYGVWERSKGYHLPGHVLMYPALWKQMNSKLMTGYTDRTVMEHFKINNSYTLMTGQQINIRSRFQLDAAELAKNGVSNGNKDRFMVLDRSETNVAMARPIPFRMVAPQFSGLAVTVPSEFKCSGTEFRYPLCAQYVDSL